MLLNIQPIPGLCCGSTNTFPNKKALNPLSLYIDYYMENELLIFTQQLCYDLGTCKNNFEWSLKNKLPRHAFCRYYVIKFQGYTSQLFHKSSPNQVVQFTEMNIQARNNKV